jgi:hypothetical protein
MTHLIHFHCYSTAQVNLKGCVIILLTNQDDIKSHGCPIGSLCTELAKQSHPMQQDAKRMLTTLRDWLTVQLKELGLGKEARQAAMHLLSRSQGIASITNTFEDKAFLRQEVKHLKQWLDKKFSDSVKSWN